MPGPPGDCQTCKNPIMVKCDPKCESFWRHRTGAGFTWLFLSARDADVVFATPVDAFAGNQVPIGPSGVADTEREHGWRIDASYACSCDSSITASFTNWESNTNDFISLPGGVGFVRADLVHPNTLNVAADSLSARADYDISYKLADINYRGLIWGDCRWAVNYLLGVRYGNLDQNLLAEYSILGVTTVETNIDFEGFGPRVGLDARRKLKGGFQVYSEGFANFLAGEWRADFQQNNIFAGQQAASAFTDDRIVSLLEFELGVAWSNASGWLTISGGYYVAGWFNSITTRDYVNAVQTNNFNIDDSHLTFDGFTGAVEVRY
ncbi:MAG: Lpg1974 family pore-forming outer membrane protein, partial [Planctomycetaceae bacterium]